MRNSNKGFTLIELIIVITILAIIGVIATQGFGQITAKAKATTDMNNADSIAMAVTRAFNDGVVTHQLGTDTAAVYAIFDPAVTPEADTMALDVTGDGKALPAIPKITSFPSSGNPVWVVSCTDTGTVKVFISANDTYAAADDPQLYPKQNSYTVVPFKLLNN